MEELPIISRDRSQEESVYAHSPPDGDWRNAHGLRDHLESVAALASRAGEAFQAADFGRYAGLWHDLGKYRRSFQDYIQGRPHGPKSHKWAGAAHARTLGGLGRYIALAIAGHHGGIPSETECARGKWEDAEAELEDAKKAGVPEDLLIRPGLATPEFLNRAARQWPEDKKVLVELFIRMLFSTLVDADYLDTGAFYQPEDRSLRNEAHAGHADLADLAGRLHQHLEALSAKALPGEVNRVRARVWRDCLRAALLAPGCFSLTVPTGGAKTLASMAFALKHARRHGFRRVIVVLPFTAIIEQNSAVYAEVFGAENVLEHHSAWDAEDRDLSERASHRHKLLCENWDAPIIVTTAVQFLESLHHNKPSVCRKLHHIVGSVVIFDEIQTMPADLLDVTLDTLRVMTRAYRMSLVCCTATQPVLAERLDEDGRLRPGLGPMHEIIRDPRPMFRTMDRIRVHWPPESEMPPVDWRELAAEVTTHERVLVIVHRRKDAWDLARLLGEDWLHLSASMLPAHRFRVIAGIKALLRVGKPCRVVSTQLVEAGVDIDFPVVYRAMAGCEALAQSAGRCNREGRLQGKGDFHIFWAPTAPPPGILEQGLAITRILRRGGELDLSDPQLYRRYFAKLYASVPTDPRDIQHCRMESDFPAMAKKYRLIEQGDMLSIVVPWPELSSKVLAAIQRFRRGYPQKGDLRLLNRATVSIPRRLALAWQSQGLITLHPEFPVPIFNLEDWPHYYDARLGLDLYSEPELDVHQLAL